MVAYVSQVGDKFILRAFVDDAFLLEVIYLNGLDAFSKNSKTQS